MHICQCKISTICYDENGINIKNGVDDMIKNMRIYNIRINTKGNIDNVNREFSAVLIDDNENCIATYEFNHCKLDGIKLLSYSSTTRKIEWKVNDKVIRPTMSHEIESA